MAHRWPLLLGLLLATLALWAGLQAGPDPVESWRLAARWTARVGFPIFIVAYSASSLAKLWPADWSRSLWQHRRWWGLGFAASHTIHLYALLAYLTVSGDTRPLGVYLFAGGAYTIMFLMALTSNDWGMRALGQNWKRLHTLGIHWLWTVFFASYLGKSMQPETMDYAIFGTLVSLAAFGLRIAAKVQGRRRASAT